MYHNFLIHLPTDGHLGCFHILAIVNSAAINIGVHVSQDFLNIVLQSEALPTQPCSLPLFHSQVADVPHDIIAVPANSCSLSCVSQTLPLIPVLYFILASVYQRTWIDNTQVHKIIIKNVVTIIIRRMCRLRGNLFLPFTKRLRCFLLMFSTASLVAQMVRNLPAMQETQVQNPWVGKIPWRREWLPTLVFLSREFCEDKSLVAYSPWGCKESDMTEWLTHFGQKRNGT